MYTDLKKEWLRRLRSDEYKQGTARLCGIETTGDEEVKRFCCLGVATDMAAEEGVVRWDETRRKEFEVGIEQVPVVAPGSSMPETGLLNKEVMNYMGIPESNPSLKLGDIFRVLEDRYTQDEILDKLDELGWSEREACDYLSEHPVPLAKVNDSGFTFEEIADVIEELL
jgi:hypothetical protein